MTTTKISNDISAATTVQIQTETTLPQATTAPVAPIQNSVSQPAPPPASKQKPTATVATKTPLGGAESQHYDHDTVLVLLDMMKRAGYGDRKQQKKSLKDVFIAATKLAEKEHGVKRSAKAGQKKFTRIKQEYSAFIAKISESGRDGDDRELYNKPAFYEQMHELERGKARHDPPAILSSENVSVVSDLPLTSTRKKAKLAHTSLMESFFEEQSNRHDALLAEIKKGNEEKAKMRNVIERLVEKL